MVQAHVGDGPTNVNGKKPLNAQRVMNVRSLGGCWDVKNSGG